jgi:hypothetical protein
MVFPSPPVALVHALVMFKAIAEEISDDISSHSLPTRLVSVAALLRRYSPSPHPLLRLLSHVPALASSNQSYLPCKSCQLYTTMFKGSKSAPREPKQDPPKNTSFNYKADSSDNMAWPWLFSRRIYPRLP